MDDDARRRRQYEQSDLFKQGYTYSYLCSLREIDIAVYVAARSWDGGGGIYSYLCSLSEAAQRACVNCEARFSWRYSDMIFGAAIRIHRTEGI